MNIFYMVRYWHRQVRWLVPRRSCILCAYY